jgi:NTE family protein
MDAMAKKVVVILQGGGALGAFECGAWKAIVPFIHGNGYELAAVAGASVGAINAGLIARHWHDADGGVGALREFWSDDIATASVPFLPLPGEYASAWNGLLTGLLLGNHALFQPAYQNWNPIADMFRLDMPLYRTQNAEQSLDRAFGRYRGNAPLLAVAATDIRTGEAVLFDSARQVITPKILAASTAIPILFSPIEIDGRLYWDGEMRSNTPMPNVLSLLHEIMPNQDRPAEYLYIVVSTVASDTNRLPSSTLESHYRFLNILLGEKLKYDRERIEVGNRYLAAMERIHGLIEESDHSPLASAVRTEFNKALSEQHGHVEFLHVGRQNLEFEHISRDFNYSPEYIARLMEQGAENASQAIAEYRAGAGVKAETANLAGHAAGKRDVPRQTYSPMA